MCRPLVRGVDMHAWRRRGDMVALMTEQVEIFGSKFAVAVPASVGYPSHSTDEFKHHEPIMERWVKGIHPGDFIVDGGASFGNYALSGVARGARAVCYEPYHEHAQCLRANIMVNGWEDHVKVREVGLWHEGEEYPVAILKQMCMRLDMPTVRLDDEFESWKLEQNTKVHLKLDIEGTELGALLGGVEFLKKHHPRIMIEDHEGVNPDPICAISNYPKIIQSRRRMNELLTGLGYTLEDVPFDVSRHYLVAT